MFKLQIDFISISRCVLDFISIARCVHSLKIVSKQ